jgi:hypothetical protein
MNCIAPAGLTYVGLAFEAAGGLSDAKAVASAAVVKALLEAEARPVLPYVGKRLEGVRSLKPITSMYKHSGLVGRPPAPAAHACMVWRSRRQRSQWRVPCASRGATQRSTPHRTWSLWASAQQAQQPSSPAAQQARQPSRPSSAALARPPPLQVGIIASAEPGAATKAVDQLSAKFEALAKGISEPALAVAKAVAVSAYRSKLASNAGAVEDFGKQLLARGKVGGCGSASDCSFAAGCLASAPAAI